MALLGVNSGTAIVGRCDFRLFGVWSRSLHLDSLRSLHFGGPRKSRVRCFAVLDVAEFGVFFALQTMFVRLIPNLSDPRRDKYGEG
jgi:hypothetical protein